MDSNVCSFLLAIMAFAFKFPEIRTMDQWANVGGTSEVVCKDLSDANKLLFCHWERTDEYGNITLELQYPPVLVNLTDYGQMGDGTTQCGIIIRNVTLADFAIWKGSIVSRGDGPPLLNNCSIQLLGAVRPTAPVIRPIGTNDNISQNDTVDVSCCSSGGNPTPEIGFIYDGAEVTSTTITDNSTEPATTCSTWSATFSWAGDGKPVTCFQKHMAYVGIVTDSKNLSILYGPKLRWMNESSHLYTISANPMPQVVEIPGVDALFQANLTHANSWDITLVPNFQILGTGNSTIAMEITNAHGKLMLDVILVGPEPSTTTTTTPVPQPTTTSRPDVTPAQNNGLLVWLSIGFAILLIVLATAYVAWKKGLVGNRGTRPSSSDHADNSTDTSL